MIQVSNLSFRYPNNKELILKNLNFSIAKGEIFGFLGPSGAGKSTTQKILYRILRDYEGSVTMDGRPLSDINEDYYNRIGVGFELPNHYMKLTGAENIKFFSSFYKRESIANADDLFELVGLSDAKDKMVEAYSKGMQMRLNFIRALINNPDIIFLDEPTAGLDPGNAQKIKEHIKLLRSQGKTIFITTHNMNTADELCDRVAFIADGEIRIIDAPKALKNHYGKELVTVELTDGRKQDFPLTNLGDNADFIQFLKSGELLRIFSMEATLEEVFLKVTGKNLKTT